MDWLQAARRLRGASVLSSMAIASAIGGCAHAPMMTNPLAAGGVNRESSVSAEVTAAMNAQGTTPRFSQVPVIPTDVRPVTAWRAAVVSEWSQKRQTERQAAALPFTLANTEAWAQRTRAKIPAGQTTAPKPDAAAQIEAFAASERARATPPPPPQ